MITSFTGENAFLSNFYPSKIEVFGSGFETVEHFFQSFKMTNASDAYFVARQPTPGKAKRTAKSLPKRADWELIKQCVMYTGCMMKFSKPEFRLLLLKTEDQLFVEGNTWGDRYWGQCPVGNGQNNLGFILMHIRDFLRAQ
jgi:ribA/ribD-fused uncharacterized protein